MSKIEAVLIVDPVQSRANRLTKALAGSYDVHVLTGKEGAEEAIQRLKPLAMISSLVLKGANGPQLCKDLRKSPDGKACMMVVHGSTSSRARDNRKNIEQKYRLDSYFPDDLDGTSLKVLLDAESLSRKKKVLRAKAQQEAEQRAKEEEEKKAQDVLKAKILKEERNAAQAASLKNLLTKPISLGPKPDESGPMTFKKLLTSDLNAKNLRAFLNRNSEAAQTGPST